MDKKHYWRIDCNVPFWEKDGFSLAVKSNEDYTDEQIVDIAVVAGVLDKDTADDYYVTAEEITNDEYEMKHWEKLAHDVDIEE